MKYFFKILCILLVFCISSMSPAEAKNTPKFTPGIKKLTPALPLMRIPSKKAQNLWKRGGHYLSGVQYGRVENVTLSDGTVVHFFPQATDSPSRKSHRYYYMPAAPRLATHPDGTPRFSMIKFVTDKSKAEGGLDGAIIDFAVKYGLTEEQRKEACKLMKKRDKKAEFLGSLPLEPTGDGNSFAIVSAVLKDKEFTPTLVHSGSAPVLAGEEVSVAARLNAYAATLLEKSMTMPASDVTVEFALKYITRLPPYRVRATINFDRYRELYDAYVHRRDKSYQTRWDPKWYNLFHRSTRESLKESEASQMLDLMTESGVAEIFFDEAVPQADKNAVITGMVQLIMDKFTTLMSQIGEEQIDSEMPGSDNEDKESAESARRKEAKKYAHYRYKKTSRSEKKVKKHYTINLKQIGARYSVLRLSGNLSTWYKKLKNNPKLVAEIKLDDPFFTRRTINIVIDGETYDIFKDMVNYAAVQVLPLKANHPQEKTIDRKYIEKNGQTATITYAPMGKEWGYKYAVQWSLRGGHLYPAHPRWLDGESQGITLQAPVRPVYIEAEADLDELGQMGFARVAVELSYSQFGSRKTDRGAIALSVAKGEPVAGVTVYPDKGTDDIMYRLIYYHKKMGKMAEKKWKRVEGNYIYCAPGGSILDALGMN